MLRWQFPLICVPPAGFKFSGRTRKAEAQEKTAENPQERKFHVKFLVNALAEWIMRQACHSLFDGCVGSREEEEGAEENPADFVDSSARS